MATNFLLDAIKTGVETGEKIQETKHKRKEAAYTDAQREAWEGLTSTMSAAEKYQALSASMGHAAIPMPGTASTMGGGGYGAVDGGDGALGYDPGDYPVYEIGPDGGLTFGSGMPAASSDNFAIPEAPGALPLSTQQAGGGQRNDPQGTGPFGSNVALPQATQQVGGGSGNDALRGSSGADMLTGSGLMSLLDKHEGGGRYDTLFGHAQRGGAFDGVDVTRMSLGQVSQFADVNGQYGNWVKQQLAKSGQDPRIATPMGRYQIVGTTLRQAMQELRLDPRMQFTPQVQDYIATHLARKRINSANTMSGKVAALRSEWEGFKNVPSAVLAQAISRFK